MEIGRQQHQKYTENENSNAFKRIKKPLQNCNQQIDNYQNFPYPLTNAQQFELNDCSQLSGINDISFFFLGINNENNICDINKILIDFQLCSENININLYGLEVDKISQQPILSSQSNIVILQNTLIEIYKIQNLQIQWGLQFQNSQIKVDNFSNTIIIKSKIFEGISELQSFLNFNQGEYIHIDLTDFRNLENSKGQTSAIKCQDVEQIVIQNSNFQDNKQKKGGCIQIVNSQTKINIQNVELFRNTMVSENSPGIIISESNNILLDTLFIQENKFLENTKNSGIIQIAESQNIQIINIDSNNNNYIDPEFDRGKMILLTDSNDILIDDCQFINNDMGIIYHIQCDNIIVQNSNFKHIFTQKNNGVGIFGEDSNHQQYINLTFKNITSQDYGFGGSIYLGNPAIVETELIYLYNINIQDMHAYVGGGICIRDIGKCKNCTVDQIFIRNGTAVPGDGGGIFTDYSSDFTFSNIEVQDCTAGDWGGGIRTAVVNNYKFYNITLINNYSYNIGGGMYNYYDSHDIIVQNVTFIRNKAENIGGGYCIEKSNNAQISDLILIENESGVHGSQIYINSQNNTQINNVQAKEGVTATSTIFFGALTHSQITNFIVQDNNVLENYGGINLQSCSDTNLDNILILNNTAQVNCGGLHIASGQNLNLMNINITYNSASINAGGVLMNGNQNIEFNNLQISFNKCGRQGGGLLVEYSNDINIFDSRFINNDANVNGGNIFLSQSQIILMKDIDIKYGSSQTGAGIQVLLSRNVDILNSKINHNIALLQGGGLFLQEVFKFNLQDSEGLYNEGIQEGGFLYSKDGSQDITIKNTLIQENISSYKGGAFYLYEVINFSVIECSFTKNQGQTSGAGIYISNSDNLLITKSQINNHFSTNGGFIHVENLNSLSISHSKIKQNYATVQGGFIDFNLIKNIQIINNEFNNNYVKETQSGERVKLTKGGLLFGTLAKSFTFSSNQVQNSYSYFKGGALFLQNIQILNIKNSTFNNNYVTFDKNIPLYFKNIDYLLSQGGSIYLEFDEYILHEQLKQHLDFDSDLNQITYNIESSIFKNSQASSGAGIFVHNNLQNNIKINFNELTFENNIADIGSGVRIIGDPQENTINILKQVNNTGLLDESVTFNGYYRNEQRIDEYTNQFNLCISGSYLDEGGNLLCDKCIENANCEGGYIPTYPNKEYWRMSLDSDELFHCKLNPGNCLGNDTCIEGTLGILCESCNTLEGYAKNYQNQCEICGENEQIIVIVMIVFMLSMILVIQQIYGMNSKIKSRIMAKTFRNLWNYYILKHSQLSGISKIIIMHCQIIYLTRILNLEFPSLSLELLSIIGNPSQSLAVKVQCIIQVETEDQMKKQLFNTSLVGFSLTFGILLILLTINTIYCVYKKYTKQQLLSYGMCTCICFFITVQPGYLQNSLSFILCRKISDGYYSKADNHIECDSDFFKNSVLPINIIIALIFGLIIPILFMYKLIVAFKIKKRNEVLFFQRAYGILFLEHKKPKFYMELLSITLKIIVVLLSIIFEEDIIAKGSLVTLVVVLYAFYTFQQWPFVSNMLNNLAILGSLVQVITVLLGMCLSEIDDTKQNIKTFISILIIIANIIFFSYAAFTISMDIKTIFKKYTLKYSKFVPTKILNHVLSEVNKSQNAKKRWKKIKQAIEQTNLYGKQKRFDKPYEFYFYFQLQKQFNQIEINQSELKDIFENGVKQSNIIDQNDSTLYKQFDHNYLSQSLKLKQMQNSSDKVYKSNNNIKQKSGFFQQCTQSNSQKNINKEEPTILQTIPPQDSQRNLINQNKNSLKSQKQFKKINQQEYKYYNKKQQTIVLPPVQNPVQCEYYPSKQEKEKSIILKNNNNSNLFLNYDSMYKDDKLINYSNINSLNNTMQAFNNMPQNSQRHSQQQLSQNNGHPQDLSLSIQSDGSSATQTQIQKETIKKIPQEIFLKDIDSVKEQINDKKDKNIVNIYNNSISFNQQYEPQQIEFQNSMMNSKEQIDQDIVQFPSQTERYKKDNE